MTDGDTRILVGVPTYAGHAWCRPRFVARLGQLAAAGSADVLVVWDGDGPADYDGWTVIHCPPGPAPETGAGILARKQELLRQHALQSGHSHLLLLESDVLPPVDVVARLLAADAAVASALYFVNARDEAVIPLSAAHARELAARGAPPGTGAVLQVRERIVPCVFAPTGTGDGAPPAARLWTIDDWLRERHAGRTRVPIVRAGLGCALLRRDALAAIPFRLPADAGSNFSDFYFYLDLVRAGIGAVADLECIAAHLQPDSVNTGRRDRWFAPRRRDEPQ